MPTASCIDFRIKVNFGIYVSTSRLIHHTKTLGFKVMEDEAPNEMAWYKIQPMGRTWYTVARYFIISLFCSALCVLTIAFVVSLPDNLPAQEIEHQELPSIAPNAVPLHELEPGRCGGSIVWTSNQVKALIQEHYPWLYRLYSSYPYIQQQHNVAMYVILHHYGGVALIDGPCPASFPETLYISPSLIAAPTSHPTILCILQELAWAAHSLSIFRYSTIRSSTGPGLVHICAPDVAIPSLSWLETWERTWLLAAVAMATLVTSVTIKLKSSLRNVDITLKHFIVEHFSWIVNKPVIGKRTLLGKKGLIQV